MTSDYDRRFAELRDFLSTWAHTKLREPSEVDDLVQDTIERMLSSNTAMTIQMRDDEFRAFAWVTMDRLVKNRKRAAKRKRAALDSYGKLCAQYQSETIRELEVESCLRQLNPREKQVLFIVANADAPSRALAKHPGFSARDLPRLREKIRKSLA